MSIEHNGREDFYPFSNVTPPTNGARKPVEALDLAQEEGNGHDGSAQCNSTAPVVSDTVPACRPIISVKQPVQNANLHIGTNVKLKGAITACCMLTIDGTVDAEVDVGHLRIANGGSFVGTAIADEAEIDGRFEGTLQVSGKLVVRRGGRVTGRLSYGQIEVECGAEIDGRLATQSGPPKKTIALAARLRKLWPLGR